MKQKQIRRSKKTHKINIKNKNKNVVNIHIHKSKRTKKPIQHMTTLTRSSVDTYQPRLPLYHPFVNAPIPPTLLQNPVNVYMKGAVTNNTPDPSALASHVHAHTPSPAPPAPSTPLGSSTPFFPPHLDSSAPDDAKKTKAPRAKKGTKPDFDETGNEPWKAKLPTIKDSLSNGTLDSLHLDTLRSMVINEKVKIKYKGKMTKDELLSAIKRKYVVVD